MTLEIDTKPLLRPHQVQSYEQDREALKRKLSAKPNSHGYAQGEYAIDRGESIKQLRRLERTMEPQIPKPFVGKEKDEAVALETVLRDAWTAGMPSQEEMRKNPAGAVPKHMAWEKRNKANIAKWKNIQLRLNAGNPDGSCTNIEQYRPTVSTLGMDTVQISGVQYHLPPPGAAPAVAFTEAQLAVLESIAPDIRAKLALMDNESRAAVKKALAATKPAERI